MPNLANQLPDDVGSLLALKEKLEEEQRLQDAELAKTLPHIYGWKWYKWAREFFESRNPMAILCAANQISKSSTQIRLTIDWATDKSKWPSLWKTTPKQFWYLYPSKDVSTAEFQEKWVPEFMPKVGQFINTRGKEECIHPVYGWKAIYEQKKIVSIQFTSGVTVYFKHYSQDVHKLQSGSVYLLACDEELPEELYSELRARTAAVGGYFRMVFTATKNQLMWYLAIEARGTKQEMFPRAHKMQVTKFDCIKYEDGSPGAYTREKIELEIEDCRNDQEVKRRIYGRFVQEQGRKYPQFDPARHMVEPFDIPTGWSFYGGVDPGSGGVSNHPSGMGIIAVNPERTLGYVVAGRRMDKIETSAGDTLEAFLELKREWPPLTLQVYDQADKDFDILSTRLGESFVKAEKNHEYGESIINTLFKNDMLFIFNTPELNKLAQELMMLMSDTSKRNAKDDLIDGALRYPGMAIPWDFNKVTKLKRKIKPKQFEWTPERIEAEQIRLRRGEYQKLSEVSYDGESDREFEAEVAEWNEAYGG